MKKKKNIAAENNSRRLFIKNSIAIATGFYIIPRYVLGGRGFIAPSDRLIVAGIGVGGKGESDLNEFFKSTLISFFSLSL